MKITKPNNIFPNWYVGMYFPWVGQTTSGSQCFFCYNSSSEHYMAIYHTPSLPCSHRSLPRSGVAPDSPSNRVCRQEVTGQGTDKVVESGSTDLAAVGLAGAV